jgi:very-short-patch-repair endonuclease
MEQELAIKLTEDRITYQMQVEIPVTTADFYFPIEPRPLLVFVDGPAHHRKAQMIKRRRNKNTARVEIHPFRGGSS